MVRFVNIDIDILDFLFQLFFLQHFPLEDNVPEELKLANGTTRLDKTWKN